jgi:para-aminobenzoate synthetase/4-amino-4-deoxychorismate lyase
MPVTPSTTDTPATCRFDFADSAGAPWRYTFGEPERVIVAWTAGEVAAALDDVQQAADAGFYVAGYVAYEAALGLDASLTVRQEPAGVPLVWFGVFRAPVAPTGKPDGAPRGAYTLSPWRPSVTAAEYEARIAAIHEAIAAGSTYQVNYTMRLHADFTGDADALYADLLAAQRGARHGAYLAIGSHRILSASPELFFHRQGERVVTRPMKGTARRGRWAGEDGERCAGLAESAKDRAENVMIVDLLRSDLGRIARTGSVRVSELFAVETYPTLFQMTSTVEASVPRTTALLDLFRALFPCGSVTGAPKVSTMQYIAALEGGPRGVYCGAIGVIRPGGDALFSVAIRTLVIDTATGVAEYGVGGGVTWDSTAEREYEEIQTKAAVLIERWPEFELLETIRLEDGRLHLWERHRDRMAASAGYFGFAYCAHRVVAALEECAAAHPTGVWRVRLLASRDGAVRWEAFELEPQGDAMRVVRLADGPIDRSDRFLYHKTTHRAAIDRFRGPCTRGEAFDVLLWNADGHVTEFTHASLVVETDGQRWTPPQEDGLLAGTLRAELLERGEIAERSLTVAEVVEADAVWWVNGVRGWVRVVVETERLPR